MTPRLRAALAELLEALLTEAETEDAQPSAPDRLLSVDEAAAMLGVVRSTLYGEMAAGRLRTIKVGRRRLVPAASVAAFIAERAS